MEMGGNMFNKLFSKEKISNIKINEEFKRTKPKKWKMQSKENYFLKYGIFESKIVLDKNNVLIDGYTSYLLAKKFKVNVVKVERI